MSNGIQFFIKYEGLIEMRVSDKVLYSKDYISSEQEEKIYWFQEKLAAFIVSQCKMRTKTMPTRLE